MIEGAMASRWQAASEKGANAEASGDTAFGEFQI